MFCNCIYNNTKSLNFIWFLVFWFYVVQQEVLDRPSNSKIKNQLYIINNLDQIPKLLKFYVTQKF